MNIDTTSRAILLLSGTAVGMVVWRWWPDLGLGIGAENAPLGWLQSNWLVACATTACIRAAMVHRIPGLPYAAMGWGLLAMAIFVAALDERFMFHEQLQDVLADLLVDSDLVSEPRAAERLAQGLTASYAVAGLIAANWLRRATQPAAWQWIRAAITVGIVAVFMDVVTDAMGPQIIEELLEFSAETLMLCGLITEVRSAANR